MKRSLKKALNKNQPIIPLSKPPRDSEASKTLLKGYSVYDSGKKRYSPPYFFETQHEAIRGFILATGKPDSVMAKFAEDYSLYFVGDFDWSLGHFTLESQTIGPKYIISLQEALSSNQAPAQKGGAV